MRTRLIGMNIYLLYFSHTKWLTRQLQDILHLVYGLHHFMPIEYVFLAFIGDHRDANHVKVLTSKLTQLEKLQNDKLQAHEIVVNLQWNCEVNRGIQRRYSNLEIMYPAFQKDKKHILENLLRNGFVHTKYSYAYPTTLCFQSFWISLIQTLWFLMFTTS